MEKKRQGENYERRTQPNNKSTEIRSGKEKTKEMEIEREYEKEITR